MERINIAEKFARFWEQWQPKVVAELNGQEVNLVKVQGTFPWHHHNDVDELFLACLVREAKVHLLTLLSTKVKNVADFTAFTFFQLITLHTETTQVLVIKHFLIDGNIFASMQIDNVLTGITDSLKFVTELSKSPATGHRHSPVPPDEFGLRLEDHVA